MASAVFVELPHGGGSGGDVVFCVVMVCLSALSLVFFAASSSSSGDGAQGKRWRRSGGRANGPVFVGGRGCACGGCRAGAGVCGTYLS